ncbi:MAG TPA: hypothetical protein VF607_16300 [Verrucomicrobiae bacterium]
MLRLRNEHIRMLRRHVGCVTILASSVLLLMMGTGRGLAAWPKLLLDSAWGRLAEWPEAMASLAVILIGGCIFFVIRAMDEVLPLLRRDHFSVGTFYVLMLFPLLVILVGSYLFTKAIL